jgi:hypothetical protein
LCQLRQLHPLLPPSRHPLRPPRLRYQILRWQPTPRSLMGARRKLERSRYLHNLPATCAQMQPAYLPLSRLLRSLYLRSGAAPAQLCLFLQRLSLWQRRLVALTPKAGEQRRRRMQILRAESQDRCDVAGQSLYYDFLLNYDVVK